MFDIENAKQINIQWVDGTRTIVPCRNWKAWEKAKRQQQYAKQAAVFHVWLS